MSFEIENGVLKKYTGDGTDVTVPEGVTVIGTSAFSRKKIEHITLPSTLMSIEYAAFEYCLSLKSLYIPDGCRTLDGFALNTCKRLERLRIPDTISEISSQSITKCDALVYNKYRNALYLGNEDNPYTVLVRIEDRDADCEIHPSTRVILSEAFFRAKLKHLTVPESVDHIGFDAFKRCEELESIELPRSMVSLAGAFSECRALTEIEIPEGITEIPRRAFASCVSLKRVTLPSTLKLIKSEAFKSCYALTEIVIPDGVTEIESDAFGDCGSLAIASLPSGCNIAAEHTETSHGEPDCDGYPSQDELYVFKHHYSAAFPDGCKIEIRK